MDIKKNVVNGVTVLELNGQVSAAPIIQALDAEIRGAISLDSLKVLLDVKSVDFVDSATLEAFLSYQKKFSSVNATLGFVNMNAFMKKVFEIVRISEQLVAFDDMDTAMKSVRARRR